MTGRRFWYSVNRRVRCKSGQGLARTRLGTIRDMNLRESYTVANNGPSDFTFDGARQRVARSKNDGLNPRFYKASPFGIVALDDSNDRIRCRDGEFDYHRCRFRTRRYIRRYQINDDGPVIYTNTNQPFILCVDQIHHQIVVGRSFKCPVRNPDLISKTSLLGGLREASSCQHAQG